MTGPDGELEPSDASTGPERRGRARSGDGAPVANEAGLAALGEQIRQSAPRRRRRLRHGLILGLVTVLVLLAAGAGYVYDVTHDLKRVEVHGLSNALTTGKESGTENILMVGSTSRCALSHQNIAYGLCSQGVNGVNSDVIMILHADPARHRLALLSIPRDLFIPNARAEGPNKVDAALYEGMSQVVRAIEDDFGIPIQHAVSLNFDQFANVVNALHGINMSFPISVFDAESGLNVQAASCVHLDGTQALEVVRARHLQYQASSADGPDAEDWPQEAQSDLARIRRDHEFLRVLATAVAKEGLDNPVTDLGLINSVKADFTFDQSWSVNDMVHLVLDFHAVHIDKVPQLTLPVSVVLDPDGLDGDLLYQGSPYGQVEFPAATQDLAAIDAVLGIGPGTDALTGTSLPAPGHVRVSVENGTGAADQATDTGDALSALGFHVTGVGDVTPVGDVAETYVYYGSSANEAAAEAVAHRMSGAVIMGLDPSQVTDGAQVTVVTGTRFTVNPPAAPKAKGSSTTASGAAPTTTTTLPSASAIESPSSAKTTLKPWDPRACKAGATPTAPVGNET